MIGRILSWYALRTIAKRSCDFPIGPEDDPYMERWFAVPRNKYFNIYIHRIRHDDDDRALHDHPWRSLSFMVQGEIVEHYKAPHGDWPRKRTLKAGEWVDRPADFAHRLTLSGGPAITVFITGPRVRDWGFHCPNGWVFYRDFVDNENTGAVGRGCGEVDL